MTTPHTIPVEVLLRATAALRTAERTPVAGPMQHSTWSEIVRSRRELQMHLDFVLAGQTIPIVVPT